VDASKSARDGLKEGRRAARGVFPGEVPGARIADFAQLNCVGLRVWESVVE